VKKPERNILACERLWKLPHLWKKAKRYAAFSHSRVDKPSGKTCSPYPQLPQARLRFIPGGQEQQPREQAGGLPWVIKLG